MASDTPNVVYGTQEDYKKLYYSNPDAALKVPISISKGFGVLKMGTALAKNDSASGSVGKMLPYDPAAITGAEVAPGRAYLVADSGTGTASVHVAMADSYKFSVGDDLVVNDDTTAAQNLGAITAIDRTTYTHMAVITATTNITTSFTTARHAYATIEGYDTCVGILEKTVDTGDDENAAGALATLILGNCVLYTGALLNVDSAARTDLSAIAFGNFTYIK